MRRLFRFVLILCLAIVCFSCSKGEKGAASTENSAAPSFVLADLNNNKVSLDTYKGKVVMLEFFASWCPPCQMSAPDVKSIYEKYRGRGLVVLAVSLDGGTEAKAAVSSFVKEFGLTYPALMDDGKTSKQYGVISIPTSFIIDRKGKIRNKHIGLIPDFSNTLSKEIEALL